MKALSFFSAKSFNNERHDKWSSSATESTVSSSSSFDSEMGTYSLESNDRGVELKQLTERGSFQQKPIEVLFNNKSSIRHPSLVLQNQLNRLDSTKQILNNLMPRLSAYRSNRFRWEKGNQNLYPPLRLVSGEIMHPADALDPCPIVNENLSKLVGEVCLTPSTQQEVEHTLKGLSERELDQVRELSMYAEESLEKSALKLLFSIHTDTQTIRENRKDIDAIAEHLLKADSTLTPELARFKSLIVKHPQQKVLEKPSLPGEPFIYFDNYKEIVKAELQLLNKALPTRGEYSLFNQSELSQQRFAFVGSGFPLTAIVLHLKTQATITLIDRDNQAIKNAKRLLNICHELEILNKEKFSIIHADALDCAFVSPGSSSCQQPDKKHKVVVSVLDLASALPPSVTQQVINGGTSDDLVVRKRNVGGVSKMLYQPYSHDQSASPYQVVAQVVPPSYPSEEQNHPLTLGKTSPDNVNSCILLLPR